MTTGGSTGQSTFDAIKDKTVTMMLIPTNPAATSCMKTAGVYQSMDQDNDNGYSELPLSYCGAMPDGDYTVTLMDSSGNNLTLTNPLEVISYTNGVYTVANTEAYADEWYPYLYYGVTENSVGVNYSDDVFKDDCDSQ